MTGLSLLGNDHFFITFTISFIQAFPFSIDRDKLEQRPANTFYYNSSGIYSTPHDLFSPLWLPKFRHFHALLKIPTKVHTLKVREPEGTRDLTLCIFFFETLSLARALRLFTLSFSELMEYSCLWQPGLFRNFFERNSSLSLHIKQRRCPVMKYKAFLVFLWHAVDSRCSCLCGGC